jgi:uncharacterized delta-60 repeat protein
MFRNAIRSRLDLCGKAVFVNTPTLLSRCVRPVCEQIDRCLRRRTDHASGGALRPFSRTSILEPLEARSLMTASVSTAAVDPTFGDAGKVLFDGAGMADWAQTVAVQADGKTLVAGMTTFADGSRHGILIRLDVDGSFDESFGTGGRAVLTAAGSEIDEFASIVVQPDGKIIAGGNAWVSGSAFGVVRFNADGSLDAGFGAGGVSVADFTQFNDSLSRVVIGPAGKIVAVGSAKVGSNQADNGDFAIARFKADGTLDSTFGSGGMLMLDFTTSTIYAGDGAGAVAFDANGMMLVGGCAGNMTSNTTWDREFALVRLYADGTLDGTFGDHGRSLIPLGAGIADLVVNPDGTILASSTSSNTGVVVRYHADGTLDPGFADGGMMGLPDVTHGAGSATYRMQSLADGTVAVYAFGSAAGGVWVLDGDGAVISSVDPSTVSGGYMAAMTADGKLVSVGTIYPAAPPLSWSIDSPEWDNWHNTADMVVRRYDLSLGITSASGPHYEHLPEPIAPPSPQPAPAPDDVLPAQPASDQGAEPVAAAKMAGKRQVRTGQWYKFKVTYTSSGPFDPAQVGAGAVWVSGATGFHANAEVTQVKQSRGGRLTVVAYQVAAPGGVFDADDNGTYTVELRPGVAITTAAALAGPGRALVAPGGAVLLGEFRVSARSKVVGSRTAMRSPAPAGPSESTGASCPDPAPSVASEVLGAQE